MKQVTLIFLFGCLFFSCKKEYQPRNIANVTIQKFNIDSASIRAIIAKDEKTVHFAGSAGKVGYTKDGGDSWEIDQIVYHDDMVPHFRSIASNQSNIFALSIENPALLYKVSDKKNEVVYTEDHEKVFYDALQFFPDGKHGIAVGDPTENCFSVILTSDGGNNWTKVSCDNLPELAKDEAFFAASNTNIKIIDTTVWIATGGAKSRVYKSIDFGKTWQVFETPIIQGNGPQGIYSIDFADKENGIVIGGDYSKPEANKQNKAVTRDGGKTWKVVSDNKNPNYKSCVQYVPNTNGQEIFAVGKTGVSFSNDAGKTWRDISKDSYYTIQFVNENIAWLAGDCTIGKLIIP